MWNPTFLLVLAGLSIICSFVSLAQRSTELFIPIGKSPGLSQQGKTTLGKVESVSTNQVTVAGRTFLFGPNSQVFLDRSSAKLTNSYGVPTDVIGASTVEIYAPTSQVIVWIKVKIE